MSENFINKFITVIIGTFIIVIDVLIGVGAYGNYLKTYKDKFGLIGITACLLPYFMVGLLTIIAVIVICKRNYKIIGRNSQSK